MSDGTRSRDNSVPGAAAGGAEDIAARLRRAREEFADRVISGSMDDYLASEFAYTKLVFTLNRNGALERLLEAVEIELALHMESYVLRAAYKAMLENVRDE